MNYPEFAKLVATIAALRHPTEGCPWDLEQTHLSLLKYLLEESYEYIDACERQNFHEMQDELGDVLLQVLLHSQIASEKGHFDIESVSKNLNDKMIRRHPHVFKSPESNLTSQQVLENWGEIKKEEKANKKPQKYISRDLLHHPALTSAEKIGKKTQKIGFDWSHVSDVKEIVEQEWKELSDELNKTDKNKDKISEELGDVLFSLAQLARHLKIDPEKSLRDANKKFIRRFQMMEEMIEQEELEIEQMGQKEMDVFWDKVKQHERNQ